MNIVAFRSNKGGEVTHSRESGNLGLPYLQTTHFTFSFKAEVEKIVIAKIYFEKAIQYLIQS